MKWDIDETKGVMWIGSEAVKSLCFSMKKELGMSFTSLICYIKNYHFKWCTLESENKKIGRYLADKFKNKKFCQKYHKDYRQFYKNTIQQLNQIDKTDFSKLSNKKLFDLLKTTTDLYIQNFDWGFIIEPMDFYLSDMLEKNLKKFHYSTGEIADVFAIVDTSFLNRESQELIQIIKHGKNTINLIKKHAYKYRWLQSAHMGRIDIPLSFFKKESVNLRK